MKTLTVPRLAALDALRAQPFLFLIPVLAVVGSFAYGRPDAVGRLVALGGVIALCVGLFQLPAGGALVFYFAYLMFDGMVKVLTNYSTAIRFGGDILLAFALLRLWTRFQREGNPDLKNETRQKVAKLAGFFVVFWIWVAIQIVNPSSLGLIAFIAGMKIYLVPMTVFFGVCLFARDRELKIIPRLMLLLGIFQACAALVDWYIGAGGLPSLHPRYASIVVEFLKGFPYRPFGTTHLPGLPAVWMFHCLFGGLLTLSNNRHEQTPWKKGLWNGAFGAFVVLALATLVTCQVRVALIRFLALLAVGLFALGKKQALIGGVVVGGLLALIFSNAEVGGYQDALAKKSFVKVEDRLQLAITRLASLQDKQAWVEARGGTWAVDEFFRRASVTTSGIGLSRMGAAAAPWMEEINKDRFFDREWTFSDNLILALFTELGLGGVLGYVFLILGLLVLIRSRNSKTATICLATCAIIFISGWGSEGILYQPDASYFWLAAGYGLRCPNEEGEAA